MDWPLVRLSRCWLINHLDLFDADCEVIAVTWIRYLIYTFLIFSSVGASFAVSSAKRNSSSTSVCTLDLACNLLRLKSFPSKRYLIGIPLSPSWKAVVSMAENIMLNRVGLVHSLAWHHLLQGIDQKTHHHFGPVQAYHITLHTFVDLTKAFDTVSREGLWKIMAKFGCPTKLISASNGNCGAVRRADALL